MRATFNLPEGLNWGRSDAISQALEVMGHVATMDRFAGKTGREWYRKVFSTSVLEGLVNKAYARFDQIRGLEYVLPTSAIVNFTSEMHKQMGAPEVFSWVLNQVDTEGWLKHAASKVDLAIGEGALASLVGKQDWLKDIYPSVDWSVFSKLEIPTSEWNQSAAAVAITGRALADSVLTEEFIESLVSETFQNTDLATVSYAAQPDEPDRVDDPILEFILERLADWTQFRYPDLRDATILKLNRAAASAAYVLVYSLIPAALMLVLGPVDSIFPIALMLGLAHFYSVDEILSLSPRERDGLKSQCSYCRAAPGAQCVTVRGNNVGRPTRMHAARLKK